MNNIEARILLSTLIIKRPNYSNVYERREFMSETSFLMELTGDLLCGAVPTPKQAKWLQDIYRKYVTTIDPPSIEATKRYAGTMTALRPEPGPNAWGKPKPLTVRKKLAATKTKRAKSPARGPLLSGEAVEQALKGPRK
jgi:hypothetical protein